MTLNGAIKQLHELQCNEDVPAYLKPAIAEVINVLLMDAQEVRHGRWIKLYHDNYKCSECGAWWGSDYNDEIINNFNYCPNCGAKMDEVE